MQKRAARRGVRALAFLLCLLMVVSLLPVMGASAASTVSTQPADTVTATEGLQMSKQLTLMSDGTYTINLEAYATGESQTVTQKSGVPLDIVLVIDQSGSMAYNDNGNSTNTESDRRMYKLQEAVRSFVSNISKNAKDYGVEHKIAMVGYASNGTAGQSSSNIRGIGYNGSGSYWVNTGLYVNGTFKNYQTNVQTETDWWGNTTIVSATDLTAQDYKDALVSVNGANGNVTASITDSINLFKASGGTYTEYGMTMAQNIFANNPTRSYKEADGTTGQSQRIVVLFTDGETDSDISTVLDKSNSLKGNSYSAKIYCVGFGSSVDTDFLSHVSSNYNSASYEWSRGSYRYSGTPVADKYSMTATNKDELDNIFTNISKDVTQSETSVALTGAAVLKDIISENFDVTNAEASAASYNVTTTDGSTYATGSKAQDYNATFDTSTKTVDVTGFNYKENYVAPSHPGEKLVVTITGLLPNQAGEKLYSNDNEKSGIYEDETKSEPFAPFDKPYTKVNTETRVVDFGMTVQIGNNVLNTNAATQQYGTFIRNSNNVYAYNLNSAKGEDGNYTFGFTGVDSALYYANAQWTKVNVIPANNVYYDDDLVNEHSTFTDGNYGYDAAVPGTTNTMTVEGGTSKTFTFTGTGIDVYCTTEKTSGWVTARLSQMVDGKDTYVDGAIMKNAYVSESPLYNVPTLSFTGLDYGTYTLTINTDDNSNYKLDGVRIYNPAQGNSEVTSKYAADEANATFTQVRQILLNDQKSFSVDSEVTGAVYVDEHHEGADLVTYEKEGPKNEVYLDQGDAIAFTVKNYQPGQKVMVGLSAPETGNGSVYLTKDEGKASQAINSVIDAYYEVIPDANGNVVIKNAGTSLISVTNVKVSGTGASSASFEVSPQLMSYVASFDTLNVMQPEPEPTPDPEPTVNNNTVSAIIRAIWAQVMDGIGKLFGRL